MSTEEVMRRLAYMISKNCKRNQFAYVKEIKIAIKALERQVPKKPLDIHYPVIKWGLCPHCKGEWRKLNRKPNRVFEYQKHCMDCGQALDWGDKK